MVFLWFPLVSFFSFVLGETKEQKTQGKDTPKESRRLSAHRMHQSCLLGCIWIEMIQIDVPKWWLSAVITRCHGVFFWAFLFIPLIFCGVAQGFSWAEDCSLSAISRQDSRPHATGLRYSQLYKWHHWMFWVWYGYGMGMVWVWYGSSHYYWMPYYCRKWMKMDWIRLNRHSTSLNNFTYHI